MRWLHKQVWALGGIASAAELGHIGYSPELIRMFSEHGGLLRVRKGWYAVPGLHGDAVLAWRVGGRLGCASAAAYYGLTAPRPDLHVSLDPRASRLRSPTTHRRRLATDPDEQFVVRHWEASDPDGTRIAVSPRRAIEQLEHCLRISARERRAIEGDIALASRDTL